MLARLAARLRARPEGSGNVEDGEVPIIRDEDCEVWLNTQGWMIEVGVAC